MANGLFRIGAGAMRAALSLLPLLLLVAGLALPTQARADPLYPAGMSVERPEDVINARKGKDDPRVGPLPQRVMTADGSVGNQMFIANPNNVVQVMPQGKTASLILKPWQSGTTQYDREIMNMGPLGRLEAFVKCNSAILKIAVALILALACWYFIYLAIDLYSNGTVSQGYRIKAYAIFGLATAVMTLSVFSFLYFDLARPSFCT